MNNKIPNLISQISTPNSPKIPDLAKTLANLIATFTLTLIPNLPALAQNSIAVGNRGEVKKIEVICVAKDSNGGISLTQGIVNEQSDTIMVFGGTNIIQNRVPISDANKPQADFLKRRVEENLIRGGEVCQQKN